MAWLHVAICVAVIYLTIPLARAIQNYIYATAGKTFFTYLVIFIVIGASALLYSYVVRKTKPRLSQYLWLIACSGILVYFTISLKQYPEEAVHFIEYGALTVLTYRALRSGRQDRTILPATILLVGFVGTVDELIQWMLPSRVWDYKDIGLNTFSGIIVAVAIRQVMRPTHIRIKGSRTSARLLLLLLTLDIVIIAFCLFNTPSLVYTYSDKFRFLSWLRNEEAMTEFGFRFRDPEIGIINSRFSPDKLKQIDTIRGETYGGLIPRYIKTGEAREKLINTFRPPVNPFLHEFLIHLFRRDGTISGIKDAISASEIKKMSDIVYREELILRKYFTNTLNYSGFSLPYSEFENYRQTGSLWWDEYESSVGKLIVSFNKATGLIVLSAILLFSWATYVFLFHLYKKQE